MIIREVTMPASKYAIKCPYAMQRPIGITVHNTANYAPARNEIAYMQRNSDYVSFHFAVDEKEAIQGVPLTRCTWNAGDGTNGKGNRQTISIEICRSTSDDRSLSEAAEENGARLVAMLCKKYGFALDDIYKHQDWNGKYCPHYILDKPNGWNNFLAKVKRYMGSAATTKTTVPAAQPNPDGSYRVIVTTPVLRVRASSTVHSTHVTSVYEGDVYTIVQTAGNWGRLKSGAGWICLDYTKRLGGAPVKAAYTQQLVHVNVNALNIREDATTSSPVVGCIRDRGVYTIVAKKTASGYTWGKLKSGAGWIALEYTTAA